MKRPRGLWIMQSGQSGSVSTNVSMPDLRLNAQLNQPQAVCRGLLVSRN